MELIWTLLFVDYVRPQDSRGCFGEGSGKLVGIVTSKNIFDVYQQGELMFIKKELLWWKDSVF